MAIKLLFFVFLSFSLNIALEAQVQLDSLKNELENTIATKQEYENNKLNFINNIKCNLQKSNLSDEERYYINEQLINEYESYCCDSAYRYVIKNIDIAQRNHNKGWLYHAQIRKAYILSVEGLYNESLTLINAIPRQELPPNLLYEYYKTHELLYLYLAEYSTYEEYKDKYVNAMNRYQDSTLTTVAPDSYAYVSTLASIHLFRQDYDRAEQLLTDYLPKLNPHSHDYAISTSTLSYIHLLQNKPELRKAYLIRSAIADIRSVTKETKSMRELAEMFFEEGDISTANRYMKYSIEDANFFNARLRNVQAAHMLPIIDHIYQQKSEAKQHKIQVMLLIISIMLIILFVFTIIVLRQIKAVAKARRDVEKKNRQLTALNAEMHAANVLQQSTNEALSESNKVREEYISRFLDLCSDYIDKLESYHKMLNKKAAMGKVDELYKTLKSSQFIEDELNDFYRHFDSAFLSIYPTFVEKFNLMLPDEEKIILKQSGRLTTELRIFALIRLGITDSNQIAKFLRSSLRTIYCYRSKLRSKSPCHDDFDERVMRIN